MLTLTSYNNLQALETLRFIKYIVHTIIYFNDDIYRNILFHYKSSTYPCFVYLHCQMTTAHWLTVYREHLVIINCYISDSQARASVSDTGK